jgi:hypothetical protein
MVDLLVLGSGVCLIAAAVATVGIVADSPVEINGERCISLLRFEQ